eukprot:363384_1
MRCTCSQRMNFLTFYTKMKLFWNTKHPNMGNTFHCYPPFKKKSTASTTTDKTLDNPFEHTSRTVAEEVRSAFVLFDPCFNSSLSFVIVLSCCDMLLPQQQHS